jgi:hypothetical protein
VAGRRLRARLRWNIKSDKVAKEFFRGVRKKAASSMITSLKDQHGTRVSDQVGLYQICTTFYQDLYREDEVSPAHELAMQALIDLVPHKFSSTAQQCLSQPLTSAELRVAAEAMVVGKSPGLDGFTIQFFTQMWELLGTEFTTMLQQAFDQGCLPGQMNNGLITLLHKGGNREDLRNWKPITLLNIAYKILAKALQQRLQVLLPEVISEEQSAFLPPRYILDNVLVIHKTIQWACESEQEMVPLKLDFRKAYDMVSYGCLWNPTLLLSMDPVTVYGRGGYCPSQRESHCHVPYPVRS